MMFERAATHLAFRTMAISQLDQKTASMTASFCVRVFPAVMLPSSHDHRSQVSCTPEPDASASRKMSTTAA